jgi:hypothetical protein
LGVCGMMGMSMGKRGSKGFNHGGLETITPFCSYLEIGNREGP